MGIVVAQSQEVAAQAQLTPLATTASTSAAESAVLALRLATLATFAEASQSTAANARSALALAQAAQATAAQQAATFSALAPLGSSIRVQALNVNTAAIVATLPSLSGRGTTGATGSAQLASSLQLSALATAEASQAMQAHALLPWLWASFSLPVQNAAFVDATLGPLASSIGVQPPPSGYAADGNYYIALAARPFYASLAARTFYAGADARPFYVLSNPNMTPTFDTLDPRETLVLTFDASAELEDGEMLTEINTLTATLLFGASGSELPTLSGQIINSEPLNLTVNGKPVTVATGRAVQVIANGGESGCRYLIAATCATSNPDKVLTLKGALPVSAS